MNLSLQETSNIVGGSLRGSDGCFSSVSIDTRTMQQNDLFIAIAGDNFDAHEFIEVAASQGAVAAIVERMTAAKIPQIVVEDTRIALGRLAQEWRNRCQLPVVGITGSNGKTTVKELTAAILGVVGRVLYTRGNFNNDIGVPLTLLKLQQEHQYAVIEMGANHHGEIAYTSGLVSPDVALITNAGAAHLEGFGSVEGVAHAKGELVESLSESGIAVLNVDDRYFELWKTLAGNCRIIGFGMHETADVRATDIELDWSEDGFENRFIMNYRGTRTLVKMRLAGQHNVGNALAAAAAAFALNIDPDQVRLGLESVVPVRGRMQPVAGASGSLLIDDTYNANPSSFTAAIDVISQLKGELWVILGAFSEMGDASAEMHRRVGRYAKDNKIVHLFATGSEALKSVEAFGEGGRFFDNRDELIEASLALLKKDVVALVKGSRSQKMEQVIQALQADRLN